MNPLRSDILTLDLGDGEIRVAEFARRSTTARRHGAIALSGEATLEQPERAGAKLAEFLKRERISARRAVIGVPAGWVISRDLRLPPADGETLRNALRIAASRAFTIPADELVIECPDMPASHKGEPLLVAALQSDRMNRILALCAAARIAPVAILPTIYAVASSVEKPSLLAARLGERELEVALRRHGRLRLIRSLPLEAEAGNAESLRKAAAEELQRMFDLLPPEPDAPPPDLVACGWPEAEAATLAARLKPLVGAGICRNDAAFALAQAGSQSPGMDFLHSRLAQEKAGLISARRKRQLALACIAVGLVVAAAIADAAWLRVSIGRLKRRHAEMKPQVDAARPIVDGLNYARSWRREGIQGRDRLRDLAQAFPEDGRIWVTSLTLRSDGKGVATGRCTDNRAPLDVVARLEAKKHAAKVDYMRSAGGSSRDVSFGISFNSRKAE